MYQFGIIYHWGRNKLMDGIIVILLGFLIILMQKRLIWDGYFNIWRSYDKYSSNENNYIVVEAEVISTQKHIIVGFDNVAARYIRYCTIHYEYNGIQYNKLIKNNPDAKKGNTINVAVYISDPQTVERIDPYPLKRFFMKEQIILFF